jgi:hypothetical protein
MSGGSIPGSLMVQHGPNNALRLSYSRKKPVIGAGKSVITLARKIVVIVWHLRTNDELYDDGMFVRRSLSQHVSVKIPIIALLEEILQVLKRSVGDHYIARF